MKLPGIIVCLFLLLTASAQDKAKADSATVKTWPSECKKVEIISSADKSIQPAYFYTFKSAQPHPLIVRLHAWSANYTNVDDIAQLCINNAYNW